MKKILIVEGNLREENNNFKEAGILTHTESLRDSISFYTKDLDIDVVNPSSDENLEPRANTGRYVVSGVSPPGVTGQRTYKATIPKELAFNGCLYPTCSPSLKILSYSIDVSKKDSLTW